MRKLFTSKFLFFWVLLWASAFFQIPHDRPVAVYSPLELVTVYVAGFSFMFAILSYLNVGDIDAPEDPN